MALETITRTLPAHWASYLINGDASGLTDDEELIIDAYMHSESLPAPVQCEPTGFCWRHDASGYGVLACECEIFTFIVR